MLFILANLTELSIGPLIVPWPVETRAERNGLGHAGGLYILFVPFFLSLPIFLICFPFPTIHLLPFSKNCFPFTTMQVLDAVGPGGVFGGVPEKGGVQRRPNP